MLPLYIVVVSVTTVFKIVFAVVTGTVLSPFLGDPKNSERGFSFIAVRIMLPCMLFGNLCLDISLEFLSQYYWAVVMSFVPMLLGGLASFLCCGLVSHEYRVLVVLGSTFQNGLLFPLSVVTNIRGIAWLDDKAVTECQQYVFLYNLCCALGLWSIGGPMIKHFKDKLTQEQEDAAEELYYEQRQHRNMKRFVKELKDRMQRQKVQEGSKARSDVEEPKDPMRSGASPALIADSVENAEGQQVRPSAVPASAPSAAIPPLSPPEEEEEEAKKNEDNAPAPASDDSVANDIIAQYRKHFAPKPESGVVFPQLEISNRVDALPALASIMVAPMTDTAAVPSATTSAAEPFASRTMTRPRPPRGREEEDDKEEVFIGPDSRPTVRGQLRWYRPARRTARPIDIVKYDRWKEISHAKRGQGADEESGDFDNAQLPLPPQLSLAGVAVPAGNADDDDVDDGRLGAVIAYPPALGEGFYSDKTCNLPDEGAARREAEAAANEQKRREEHMSPKERAEAAAAHAFHYSDFHTLSISPPSTPPPEEGEDVLVHAHDNACAYRWRKFKEFSLFAIQTPPVYITFLAILVSTVPPLRWCAQTYFGLAVIKGIALVGTACVPFQLVALGCTLARKKEEAAPLILQEKLESEDESATSGEEGEPVIANGRPEANEQAGQQRSQAVEEPRRNGASAASAEAVLASRPVFDVDAAFDAIAAKNEAQESRRKSDLHLVVKHGTSSRSGSGNTRKDGGTAGKDGHTTQRKTQKQLRNIALRRKREMLAAMGAVRRFWHRIPDATRFTCIVLFLRLLLIPAISFFIVHWLIRMGVMPLDRSFIVSILIGISSPAAVNASLVCTINDYHAGEFSRMIFIMYCLAAVTSTIWLALSISYTSAFIPEDVIIPHPEDW